jgi:photosystem II stability/assembly factor-like uncharacterized protein
VRRPLLCWLRILAVAIGAVIALRFETSAAQPANSWVNVTGTLANMASECGNLTLLSAVPHSNNILAAVARKGLWMSGGGGTWAHVGGVASNRITKPSSIVYDPVRPGVFWMTAIYTGGGLNQTSDNGHTFRQLGSITHNDFVSVNFRDPERQTLLAGGHEQSQTVYQSSDSGRSWTNIGLNLPPNTGYTSHPLIINSVTYLVNAQAVADRAGGIFRTTNAGTSWRRVSDQGPLAAPLVTANGTIYWPINGGLLKSTNAGSTWTQVGRDLRAISPIELSDGKLVSIAADNLVSSEDGGVTWSPFGATLPFTPTGLIYSEGRRAFLIWRSDCGAIVRSDAIMEIQ